LTRRTFIGGATLGSALFAGLSWGKLAEETPELPMPPARLPLKVKPVLLYHVYQPRPQTSWRPWGGIQTEEAAADEVKRIEGELQKLQAAADFPLEMANLTATKNAGELAQMPDVQGADVLLVYANDGDLNAIAVGGAGAWAQPPKVVPELVKKSGTPKLLTCLIRNWAR
jgi:hypothetical protein